MSARKKAITARWLKSVADKRLTVSSFLETARQRGSVGGGHGEQKPSSAHARKPGPGSITPAELHAPNSCILFVKLKQLKLEGPNRFFAC